MLLGPTKLLCDRPLNDYILFEVVEWVHCFANKFVKNPVMYVIAHSAKRSLIFRFLARPPVTKFDLTKKLLRYLIIFALGKEPSMKVTNQLPRR